MSIMNDFDIFIGERYIDDIFVGNTSIDYGYFEEETESPDDTETYYFVSGDFANCDSSNNVGVYVREGSSFSTTITPMEGYDLGEITISMGGKNIVQGTTMQNGTIRVNNITGDVIIKCHSNIHRYKVTYNLTNCQTDHYEASVAYKSTFKTKIIPDANYNFYNNLTVSMDGNDITEFTRNGKSVEIGTVTGDIEITCACYQLPSSGYLGVLTPDTLSVLGTKSFTGRSPREDKEVKIDTNLYYQGEHCNVYVNKNEKCPIPITIGKIFDDVVYPLVTSLMTTLDFKICIVISTIDSKEGITTYGYYKTTKTPKTIFLNSYDKCKGNMASTLAHEFQHLIEAHRCTEDKLVRYDTWINEGLSMMIQEQFEGILTKRVNTFLSNKTSVLKEDFVNKWNSSCYSVAYVFWRYIFNKCGQGTKLFKDFINGYEYGDYRDVEKILQKYIDKNLKFDDFLEQFKKDIKETEKVDSIEITGVYSKLYGINGQINTINLRLNTYYGITYNITPSNIIAPSIHLSESSGRTDEILFFSTGDYKIYAQTEYGNGACGIDVTVKN